MTTPATFAADLLAAKAGAVLELQDGRYGALIVSKKPGVTIKGGPGAIFDTVNVTGSPDTQLIGFAVDMPFVDGVTKSNSNVVRIYSSGGSLVEGLKIAGAIALTGIDPSATTLDASGNIIGLPTGTALFVQDSDGVEIVGNEITRSKRGIAISNSKVSIRRNDIHNIRTSPIAGYLGNDSVIDENHCWASQPWSYGGSGDHGDFIHPWTVPSQLDHTRGLKITNNLYETREGRPIMGIYLDTNTNPMGFVGGEISGNILVSSNGQGMRLENVEQFNITGNQLFASDPIPTDIRQHPRITLYGRGGDTITGNRASNASCDVAPAGWLASITPLNTFSATKAGEADAAVKAWLAKFRAPSAPPSTPARDPLVIIGDMEALCAELRSAV